MARIKHTKAIEANPKAAKKQLMLISKLKEKRKKQQHNRTSTTTPMLSSMVSSSSSDNNKKSEEDAADKKKRRWKPGTVVKREIRKLTRSTNLLFPKLSFCRVVREICQDKIANGRDIRFTKNSMKAIQVLLTLCISYRECK
jgi:hypothetical protein